MCVCMYVCMYVCIYIYTHTAKHFQNQVSATYLQIHTYNTHIHMYIHTSLTLGVVLSQKVLYVRYSASHTTYIHMHVHTYITYVWCGTFTESLTCTDMYGTQLLRLQVFLINTQIHTYNTHIHMYIHTSLTLGVVLSQKVLYVRYSASHTTYIHMHVHTYITHVGCSAFTECLISAILSFQHYIHYWSNAVGVTLLTLGVVLSQNVL